VSGNVTNSEPVAHSPAQEHRSNDLRSRHSAPAISATEPDWQREYKAPFSWSPPYALLASLRDYQRWRQGNVFQRVILSRWAVLRHRCWSVVTGADIPLNARIAGGLKLTHPNGVVVHPMAEIGPNCLLFQQVTLGTGGKLPGAPRLLGHNAIGAGAKILGGVTIGRHAKVGANAVVLCDVPEGATAVGIPARIVTEDDAALSGEDLSP